MIKTTQMSQTEPEVIFFLPAAILMVWLAALYLCFARRDRAYIACCADSGGALPEKSRLALIRSLFEIV